MSRLMSLLHVAQHVAKADATVQQGVMLHVAPPRECNMQQPPDEGSIKPSRTLRDTVEFERLLAIVAPANGTQVHEYAEIRAVAAGDMAAAIISFREMANQLGL